MHSHLQQQLDFLTNVALVRVTASDKRNATDAWRDLCNLVIPHGTMYPAIDKWLTEKVGPQLACNERIATLAYVKGEPALASIVKPGARTKICHLSVLPSFQHSGLGQLLFTLTAMNIKGVARRVHFTLPESLWEQKRSFFESFGFQVRQSLRNLYRNGVPELLCDAPYSRFWDHARDKTSSLIHTLSGLGTWLDSVGVLSIRPSYAKQILDGTKRVEIRKSFATSWKASRMCLYATREEGSIVGTALIKDVVRSNPLDIWETFGDELGCTRTEYFSYVGDASKVSALVLEDVHRLASPLNRHELWERWGVSVAPPQSHCSVRSNPAWLVALAIAGATGVYSHLSGAPPQTGEQI